MQRTRRRMPVLSLIGALLIVGGTAIAVTRAADNTATGTAIGPRVQAAERLVIRYSASGFELVSRMPLQKVLPPSVELPATKSLVSGSWFEVQSDAGAVLYRRRMDSPRMIYTEVPLADDPDVLKRAEVAVDTNVFSVLVPAGKDAQSLVFFDSNTDIKRRNEAASAIGRIGLR